MGPLCRKYRWAYFHLHYWSPIWKNRTDSGRLRAGGRHRALSGEICALELPGKPVISAAFARIQASEMTRGMKERGYIGEVGGEGDQELGGCTLHFFGTYLNMFLQ